MNHKNKVKITIIAQALERYVYGLHESLLLTLHKTKNMEINQSQKTVPIKI
jgi:hypothetical protein